MNLALRITVSVQRAEHQITAPNHGRTVKSLVTAIACATLTASSAVAQTPYADASLLVPADHPSINGTGPFIGTSAAAGQTFTIGTLEQTFVPTEARFRIIFPTSDGIDPGNEVISTPANTHVTVSFFSPPVFAGPDASVPLPGSTSPGSVLTFAPDDARLSYSLFPNAEPQQGLSGMPGILHELSINLEGLFTPQNGVRGGLVALMISLGVSENAADGYILESAAPGASGGIIYNPTIPTPLAMMTPTYFFNYPATSVAVSGVIYGQGPSPIPESSAAASLVAAMLTGWALFRAVGRST